MFCVPEKNLPKKCLQKYLIITSGTVLVQKKQLAKTHQKIF